MRRISAMLAVVVLGYGAAGIHGEDSAKPLDDQFLIKAASCGHAQIEIGKLADQRANSPKAGQQAG
jgi:predicted outer membrane protein